PDAVVLALPGAFVPGWSGRRLDGGGGIIPGVPGIKADGKHDDHDQAGGDQVSNGQAAGLAGVLGLKVGAHGRMLLIRWLTRYRGRALRPSLPSARQAVGGFGLAAAWPAADAYGWRR